MEQHQPKIAIIDSNTLAVMGMKQLIMSVSPVVCVDTFGCMAELEANHPEQYVHFFVAMNIVLENRSFFIQHCHRTIVLTLSVCPDKQLSDFHCLCVSVPGNDLVRSMLMMMQHGHRRNDNIAGTRPTPQTDSRSLSDREAEVMVLIVKGYIVAAAESSIKNADFRKPFAGKSTPSCTAMSTSTRFNFQQSAFCSPELQFEA